MADDGKAKKGFTEVASVSVGPQGRKLAPVGDADVDAAIELLEAGGYVLQSMLMPPSVLALAFANHAQQSEAIIIHKHGKQAVKLTNGEELTESLIAVASKDFDGPLEDILIPVKKFVADRRSGAKASLMTMRLN